MKTLRILANDGLAESAQKSLEEAGFEVMTIKVAQEQLLFFLNREKINVLIVRSATQVDRKLIEGSESLKLIIRAGVGLDNIDRVAAAENGIGVQNTPGASANAVAELVLAHLFSGMRMLHQANRDMPLEGDQHFKSLKKRYSKGRELQGKTLGIIGFGRIGQQLAKKAFALGMNVIFHDHREEDRVLNLDFADGQQLSFTLTYKSFNEVLKTSDYITLHVPRQDKPLIGSKELLLMKKGSALINAARGGIVDEPALVDSLNSGHLAFAALDVFENEPQPEITLLMQPNLSLSPHIGGSTIESQNRIGEEIVRQIKEFANES